jgi:hypothetical protein
VRLLDLFCGRWGWSRAFAARGWECIGIDLTRPPENPENCAFIQWDIFLLNTLRDYRPDFIVASSPCEQFSVHGMKHFHPEPPYPELGINLFNHTRRLCEASGVPYVMENVRYAQGFVGSAKAHCGPFYLWGSAVPPLMPQGIKKGFQTGGSIIQKLKRIDRQALTDYRRQNDGSWSSSGSQKRREWTAKMAQIPPELANCVADYAERLLEARTEMPNGDSISDR